MAFNILSILGISNDDPYAPQINTKRILLIAGAVGLVVVGIIVFVIISSLGNSASGAFMGMLAKQESINKLIMTSQMNIKSDDLAKTNSEAILLFNSDTFSLSDQLSQQFNQSSLSDASVVAAQDSTVDDRLSSAITLGTFDGTYRDVMHQKISDILAVAPTIRNAKSSSTYQAIMDKYINDLKTVDKNLEAISF
ncbi:MAG TPA: hypothetical protein VNG90_00920 [Candidatus Acidoferrum sp.]|nr:hypothetical protein [Candidatus Acidoferrum sp.]